MAKPRSGKYYEEPATLSDIFIETQDLIWAVGDNGVILRGTARYGFEDISFKGNDENLRSITKLRDGMVIASDYALHRFDGHLLSPLKPVVDPTVNRNTPTPLKIKAVDDILFCFDIKHAFTPSTERPGTRGRPRRPCWNASSRGCQASDDALPSA